MNEIGLRLFHLVPILLFIAWVYLALHMIFARYIRSSDSVVLWFFSIVTGPLTRPIRALLPPGTPDRRVRALSFAVYFGAYMVVWIVRAVVIGGASGGPGAPG